VTSLRCVYKLEILLLPFFDSPSSLGYYRLSGVPFHRGNVVENT
jgi:hypothetical protein